MGGGLAFLNKKTWHPGRFQNQEEVWKREQLAVAEAKKLEELQKQMLEERKRQEMSELAVAAGRKKEGDRMDWMYQGGLAAQQDAAKRADEHLLGKPAALQAQQQQQEVSKCEETSNLPTFMAEATPASQNEAWARLNNDPLLMIKKRQQDQLKTIRDNPVKMQQIIQEIQSGKHKDKKKKSKKSKKEKRKKDRGSGSDSSSDSERDQPNRARHPPPPAAGAMGPPPHRGEHRQQDRGTGGDAPRGFGSGQAGGDRHKRSRSRSRSPGYGSHRDRDHGRDRDGGERYGQGPADSYGRREGREEGRGEGRRDGRGDGRAGGRGEGWGDDRGEKASGRGHDRHDRREDRDDGRGHRGAEELPADKRHGGERNGDRDAAAAARPREEAKGPSKDSRYGLAHSTTAPEQLRQYDTSQRAAETRARLEEGARKREEEDRAKAAQRHQKREYRTGQMTDEERQKRLAEMTSNASEHEQQRKGRLQQAQDAEAATEGRLVTNVGGVASREGDAFAKAASRDVYEALTASGGSLEARVSSRKHFNTH